MSLPAQAGSDALFESRVHDFGSVPSGPVLTHYYRFTNNTNQTVHVAGCRVSCGCVAATAVEAEVRPGETGSIYATMDTRRFSGSKSVIIYVTFDRPRWEEVQLTISAYGRSDMTMGAESLTFGSVNRAGSGTARMTVTLRQPQWAVQKVASGSDYVLPTIKELRRSGSEVEYELSAQLKPGLPVGKWVTEVTMTTNSSVAPTIRIPAIVEVTPMLVVSPGEVTIAPTSVGNPSESKLMVRGGQPFRITEIQGTDASLSAVAALAESRPVHVITVKFDPKDPGQVSRKLKIVTDLPAEGTAEVSVKASAVAKRQ